MATASLTEDFGTLTLNVENNSSETQQDAKCLPFSSGPDSGIITNGLGQVDRYLFRLFDKHSDGSMDSKWVKSRDANQARFHHKKDIFAWKNRERAAQALRRHLQWTG